MLLDIAEHQGRALSESEALNAPEEYCPTGWRSFCRRLESPAQSFLLVTERGAEGAADTNLRLLKWQERPTLIDRESSPDPSSLAEEGTARTKHVSRVQGEETTMAESFTMAVRPLTTLLREALMPNNNYNYGAAYIMDAEHFGRRCHGFRSALP